MNTLGQQKLRNRLVLALWSALFIKCFCLEYLVIRYDVPINSTIYVWSLSLLMAGVATIIYLQRKRHERDTTQNRIPLFQCIWALIATGILLLSAIHLTKGWINDLPMLPIYAALIGLGYTAQGVLLKQLPNIISGFGWWIGCAILARLTSPNDLLAFAGCILLFSTLPMLTKYTQLRQTERKRLRI